jgi:hypothetical protein
VEWVAWAVLVGLAASAAPTGPTMTFPDAETALEETAPQLFRLVAIEATGSTIPSIAEAHLIAIGPRRTGLAARHAVTPLPTARQVHVSR